MTTETTAPTAQSTALAAASTGGLSAFLANLDSEDNVFTAMAQEKGVGNGAFLRFSGDTGKWTNSEGKPVEEGSQMLFHLLHADRGWLKWYDKKIIERQMVPIVSGQKILTVEQLSPMPEPKKHVTDGWREFVVVPVRDVLGGPQMDLTLPCDAPWRPINKLIKDFGALVRMNKDSKGRPKIPLVAIGSRSFQVKNEKALGATKYAPLLEIVDWYSEDDLTALLQSMQSGDPAPAADVVTADKQAQLAAPQQATAAAPAATQGQAAPQATTAAKMAVPAGDKRDFAPPPRLGGQRV